MQSTHTAPSVKKLRGIQRSVDQHWVGDGFPVRTLFAYPNLGIILSPFLLLDYAGPMEFSPTEARRGGLFEMVQLWVNLPARDKMAPPRYQGIVRSQIPTVRLPHAQGEVRVIAGEFAGVKGPARTFTPSTCGTFASLVSSGQIWRCPMATPRRSWYSKGRCV
jgi:redox-sensitive bicupin YhaK (pirin superfamily)